MLRRFYGTITIRFEGGKVTCVETEIRRTWQYCDLREGQPGRKLGTDMARNRSQHVGK